MVEGNFLATIEGGGHAGGIEMLTATAGAEFDVLLGKPIGSMHEQFGTRLLAAQVFLAERRAMIRSADLLADEQNAPA